MILSILSALTILSHNSFLYSKAFTLLRNLQQWYNCGQYCFNFSKILHYSARIGSWFESKVIFFNASVLKESGLHVDLVHTETFCLSYALTCSNKTKSTFLRKQNHLEYVADITLLMYLALFSNCYCCIFPYMIMICYSNVHEKKRFWFPSFIKDKIN